MRDLRLEKISNEPRLNAFQFANLKGLFDLIKFGATAAKDDTIDGILMQHFDQALHRHTVQIEFSQHFNRFLFGLFFEPLAHHGSFFPRANQDEPTAVL